MTNALVSMFNLSVVCAFYCCHPFWLCPIIHRQVVAVPAFCMRIRWCWMVVHLFTLVLCLYPSSCRARRCVERSSGEDGTPTQSGRGFVKWVPAFRHQIAFMNSKKIGIITVYAGIDRLVHESGEPQHSLAHFPMLIPPRSWLSEGKSPYLSQRVPVSGRPPLVPRDGLSVLFSLRSRKVSLRSCLFLPIWSPLLRFRPIFPEGSPHFCSCYCMHLCGHLVASRYAAPHALGCVPPDHPSAVQRSPATGCSQPRGHGKSVPSAGYSGPCALQVRENNLLLESLINCCAEVVALPLAAVVLLSAS